MLGKACASLFLGLIPIGACGLAGAAHAADWSGYASVATDYRYRGVSLLDSGPALQGGIEGRFDDTWLFGADAARVDRQWTYHEAVPEHLQVELHAGADFGCGADCRARVLLTRYMLPGPGGRDWTEASVSLALFARTGVAYSYSQHGLGLPLRTRSAEAWFEQPLPAGAVLELSYGQVEVDRFDYGYARAGVSRRFGRVVADLALHWSDHALRRIASDEHATHAVLTLSTAF